MIAGLSYIPLPGTGWLKISWLKSFLRGMEVNPPSCPHKEPCS